MKAAFMGLCLLLVPVSTLAQSVIPEDKKVVLKCTITRSDARIYEATLDITDVLVVFTWDTGSLDFGKDKDGYIKWTDDELRIGSSKWGSYYHARINIKTGAFWSDSFVSYLSRRMGETGTCKADVSR